LSDGRDKSNASPLIIAATTKKLMYQIFIFDVISTHTIASPTIINPLLINIFLSRIGLIFLRIHTTIAHHINTNSITTWVIVAPSNPRPNPNPVGIVISHNIIPTITPIPLILSKTFCSSVATKI
jgi:hypothetical protein